MNIKQSLILEGCLGGLILGTGFGLLDAIGRLEGNHLPVPSGLVPGTIIAFAIGAVLLGHTLRRYWTAFRR